MPIKTLTNNILLMKEGQGLEIETTTKTEWR